MCASYMKNCFKCLLVRKKIVLFWFHIQGKQAHTVSICHIVAVNLWLYKLKLDVTKGVYKWYNMGVHFHIPLMHTAKFHLYIVYVKHCLQGFC